MKQDEVRKTLGWAIQESYSSPLYEVAGKKHLSKEVQGESCLCGVDYVMSYVPRV